jgi:NADPH:quinone reductase-like Zn-dependent oxidoreductase
MKNEKARIVKFRKLGGPEVLEIDELPMPEPKANEARIKVIECLP